MLTYAFCDQTAIAHVKKLLSQGKGRSRNTIASPFSQFDVSPLVKALADSEHTGVAILNNEWDVIKVHMKILSRKP